MYITNNIYLLYRFNTIHTCIFVILETDPFKHLKHSLDVWHKSKKLASSLAELARKSAFKVLLYWIKPIVNHFWWCCNTCNGKVDRLLKRWVGILHHVNNNHVWPGGRYETYTLWLYTDLCME